MGAKQSNTNEIPKITNDGMLDSSEAIIILDPIDISGVNMNMVPIVDRVGCNCMEGYVCSDAKRGTEIKCECVPPCECKPVNRRWFSGTTATTNETVDIQDRIDSLHARFELIKTELDDMNKRINDRL